MSLLLQVLKSSPLSATGSSVALYAIPAIALLLWCASVVFQWFRMYWHLRNVTGPKERWPFSMVLDVRKALSEMDPSLPVPAKLFNFAVKLFDTFADQDLSVTFFGPQPFLLGVTPDTVQAILTNTQNINKPFLYTMMKPWIGSGILISEKHAWKPMRKALMPAFHTKTLENYIPAMNRAAQRAVHRLRSEAGEGYLDVLPQIRRAAFGVLLETVLGVDIDAYEAESTGLLQVNDEISTSLIARMLNILHWPDALFNRSKEARRFYKNTEIFRRFCDSVYEKRLANYSPAQERKSFLDILLGMHVEDGTITEQQVRDEVKTIFIGGFDTTATAAAFTLHLLGNHPRIQEKVHEELDAVFGNDTERPVTVEDMKGLTYLQCVIKEAMRLFPPVPVVARNVEEDFMIGKHTIPRGTVALIILYFLHRHPRFYENPNDFFPERFLDESTKQHAFMYTPFSGGPRNCMGQRFSALEDTILLAGVLRCYKVESKLPSKDLQLSVEIILRPLQGLEVKLTPRNR